MTSIIKELTKKKMFKVHPFLANVPTVYPLKTQSGTNRIKWGHWPKTS